MIRFLMIAMSLVSLGVFTFDRTDTKTPVCRSHFGADRSNAVEPNFDLSILNVQFCGDTLPLHQSSVAKRYQNAVRFYDHPCLRPLPRGKQEEDEANRGHPDKSRASLPTSNTCPTSKVR